MNNKSKYASLLTASMLALSLVACSPEQEPMTLGDRMDNSGVKKIEDSDKSMQDSCKNPVLKQDGSYECEIDKEPLDTGDSKASENTSSGSNSALWFFSGYMFGSQSEMRNSSSYVEKNLSNGTKNLYSTKNNGGKSSLNKTKSNAKTNSTKTSTGKTGGFGSGGRGASGGS